MELIDIILELNTQEKCIDFLEKKRWGDTPRCTNCGSIRSSSKRKELRHKCHDCGISFSVLVGTIFHATKLPLTKWFMAISLILDAKKGISSLQLSRPLQITRITAWSLQARIRKAMKEDVQLNGIIQVDEAFIGGSTTNMHKNHIKKKNIKCDGKEHKNTVLGMIDNENSIVLKVIQKANKQHIRPVLKRVITKESTLVTDGHGSYVSLKDDFRKHIAIIHKKGERVKGKYNMSSIEGFWALLKRAVTGVYHCLSIKHLQSYMDEIAFKFNHKFKTNVFDILINNLLLKERAIK
jgi:transposase-like protein